MMDSLSVNKLERQVTCDLFIAFERVGCEIFFRVDPSRICFAEELLQHIHRPAFSHDKIRMACPQIVIQRVQAFVNEIAAARGGAGKSRVEEKDWNDGTCSERGMQRSVIRQS